MPQKLTLVSVLTLLVLAGTGTILVASHAFDRSNPNNIQALPTTPGPAVSNRATAASTPTTSQTTANPTSSTQSSTTTTVSNSTSTPSKSGGPSGSLLLTGPPQPSGHSADDGSHSDDGGYNSMTNTTSTHTTGDD